MKKIVVAMGIGNAYEAMIDRTALTRDIWLRRHGWEFQKITKLPNRAERELSHLPFALRTHLSKLLVPDLFVKYDLVLFVESDTLFHHEAPCISEYERYIPEAGFAAVHGYLPQERRPIFGWSHSHYEGLIDKYGLDVVGGTPSNPNKTFNAGVELYRPAEVAESWMKLFENNRGLTDEHLLTIHEVQKGNIYYLPNEWNQVWLGQKFRYLGLKPASNKARKVYNYLVNKTLWKLMPSWESKQFRKLYPTAHIHHFTGEGFKTERFCKAIENIVTKAS